MVALGNPAHLKKRWEHIVTDFITAPKRVSLALHNQRRATHLSQVVRAQAVGLSRRVERIPQRGHSLDAWLLHRQHRHHTPPHGFAPNKQGLGMRITGHCLTPALQQNRLAIGWALTAQCASLLHVWEFKAHY